jgi:hypothetical protein
VTDLALSVQAAKSIFQQAGKQKNQYCAVFYKNISKKDLLVDVVSHSIKIFANYPA